MTESTNYAPELEVTNLSELVQFWSMDSSADERLGNSEWVTGYCELYKFGSELDLVALAREFPNLETEELEELRDAAGAIYRVDSQGFRDVSVYRTEEELSAVWEELQDREALALGPAEDDYVIFADADEAELYTVFSSDSDMGPTIRAEDSLGKFPTELSALQFARARMDTEQFFPNVWVSHSRDYPDFGRVQGDASDTEGDLKELQFPY